MEDAKQIIMVIDDQSDFVDGVKLILEAEGYEVWTAADGQQALDRLENAFKQGLEEARAGIAGDDVKILPDLILADIMMPKMDGYAFHEQVRANPYLTHIPFIFVTAKTDASDIRHGKELGADDYLTKPCQPDDLLASVKGKLKRTSQRRAIVAQYMGNPSTPSAIGVLVIIAIIVVAIIISAAITMMLVG